MKTSESIKEIAAALAKAQRELKPVVKDKIAHVKSDKGSYSFAYADLASCIDAVREALSTNGIAIVQGTGMDNGIVTVETRLVHASGEWMESSISMRVEGTRPQNVGSAITYARRYGLSAMVGISSEEDDDANAAQGNQREVKTNGKPSADAAAKVRAAAAKPPPIEHPPATPDARRADLRTRMNKMGIPGADHLKTVAEGVGHAVDKDTVLSADDWTRAVTHLAQLSSAAETLNRARQNVAEAFGV